MENFSLFDPENAVMLQKVCKEHNLSSQDVEDLERRTEQVKARLERLRNAKNATILELVDTLHAVNDTKA